MSQNNLVSIILPVYNGEKFLAQSIQSCLCQTYSNIELIIVNDCSTDNSLDIAIDFQKNDDRIIIINNVVNKKLPASLNIGHKNANGQFFSWTSDDNFYEKNAIEVMLNELLKTNSDVVYANINIINAENKVLRKHQFLPIENIVFGNQIGSCFLYKRSVFYDNSGYDENLFLLEDYDFWLKSIKIHAFRKIDKHIYNYRKHNGSLTSQIHFQPEKKDIFVKNTHLVYEKFYETYFSNSTNMVRFSCNEILEGKTDFNWIMTNIFQLFDDLKQISNNKNFDYLRMKRVLLNKSIASFSNYPKNKISTSKSLFFFIKYFYKIIIINDIKLIIRICLKKM